MTSETQTTAEQIAAEFVDGMTTRVTRGCTCGVGSAARGHAGDCEGQEAHIDEVCIAAHGGLLGFRLASDQDRRYEFADGSVIVTHDGIWDLGLTDRRCGCWAGEGHSPECDAAHGTTTETITLEQIRSLRAEAAEAGDVAMVDLCERAELALYDGARPNPAPRDANAVDLEAVVEVIRENEAQQ